MTISQRVFYLLEKQNKKQIELSEFTGISTSTISAWNKRGTNPAADTISTIADFFNVSTDYLLTGKERIVNEPEQEKIKSVDAKEQRLLNAFRSLPLEEQFCFIGKIEQAAESYNSEENVG